MEHGLFKYFGIYMLLYLPLALVEIFLGDWLIDLISLDPRMHFYVYLLLLLLIDPLLVRSAAGFILKKYERKEGEEV